VAQFLNSEAVFKSWRLISFLLHQVNVVLQVFEGVRLKIAEVYYVVVVFKCVGETESVKVCALALLILIHIARNVIFIVFIIRRTLPVLGLEGIFGVSNVSAAARPFDVGLPILLG
jgi:hypothetical protein